MTDSIRVLRQTARGLLRAPGLSAISVVALGLGIGLTATMFSITWGALFRGMPFDEPHELVYVSRHNPERGIDRMTVPFLDYLDWRREQTSLEHIGAYVQAWQDLADEADYAARVAGVLVTPSVFSTLGVDPYAGRLLAEGDAVPGSEPVVLVSHRLWESRYGSDRALLGATLRVGGRAHTVVGIMPPGFGFPQDQDLWLPLAWDPADLERGRSTVSVLGRLRDGVAMESATAEMAAIAERLAREHPETNAGWSARVEGFVERVFGDDEVRFLWTMIGAGAFVLLIACANVANLLLARASARTKEVAIRSALGAARWRVVGGLLLEAALLSLAGGALGVGLAYLGVKAFNDAIASVSKPFWVVIRVDHAVLLAVLAAAVVAALLAGGIPAWRTASVSTNDVLKDESRGSSSLRAGRTNRAMIVTGVALAFPLLVSAGLMIKSVGRFQTDPGFTTEGILVGRLGLSARDYPDAESRLRFFDEIMQAMRARPGVEGVAFASQPPGLGTGYLPFELEGTEYVGDTGRPSARNAWISPEHFALVDVEASRGRVFERADREGNTPVMIVNESFARTFLAGEDPVGRRVRLPDLDGAFTVVRTIVGVVPDLRMGGNEARRPEGMYFPLHQSALTSGHVLVRTSRGDPLALAQPFRDEVRRLDPHLPVHWMRPLDGAIRDQAWFVRVFGWVFSIFGAVALFLAAVGLYGVMASSVSQRTREMGVRMAFGAERRDVLRLILRQGMTQVLAGSAVGLILAFFLSRLMGVALYDVEPRDPTTFVTVAAVLMGAGLLATVVPAVRATRLDPVEALRAE